MTIEEGKKLASDKAWEEAKGYYEKGDVDCLEQQIRNETEIMVELADDCNKLKKKLKWFAIGSGLAAVASGIIFYKLGEQNVYKFFVDTCEDQGGFTLDLKDKRTKRLYEIKTECLGD